MTVSSIRSAQKFRQTALLIDDQSTVLDIHAAIFEVTENGLENCKNDRPCRGT